MKEVSRLDNEGSFSYFINLFDNSAIEHISNDNEENNNSMAAVCHAHYAALQEEKKENVFAQHMHDLSSSHNNISKPQALGLHLASATAATNTMAGLLSLQVASFHQPNVIGATVFNNFNCLLNAATTKSRFACLAFNKVKFCIQIDNFFRVLFFGFFLPGFCLLGYVFQVSLLTVLAFPIFF